MTDNEFAKTLGLSGTDQTSAWGYDLAVGNGPNSGSTGRYGDDRDPQSANSALTLPPYTALIGARAPGGKLVTVPGGGGPIDGWRAALASPRGARASRWHTRTRKRWYGIGSRIRHFGPFRMRRARPVWR